ncbi:MAG TPA: response regulator [Gemmatimonadales bacterium]|jgi:DNA-binding NtrC family response regulator|nr:response regulator [Gemmatimonadales bacterium]
MTTYKILFVDDDAQVLKSLGDYFTKLGHEVFRAASGRDGLKAYDAHHPDVVVLDLFMPGMSGMEVLERLARREAMVIMLTGYGELENAIQAMRLGAENFLTKPVEMAHLLAAVEKAAEKAALRVENVELKERLSPGVRRRLLRYGALTLLIAASLWLGRWIGGDDEARPERPIPVPLNQDTAIPRPD